MPAIACRVRLFISSGRNIFGMSRKGPGVAERIRESAIPIAPEHVGKRRPDVTAG
jgi:hypothetical protein